jgi:hypothetical protein
MAEGIGETQLRLAKNQALYRKVNEQLEALNEAFEDSVGIGGEWVCECADPACTMPIAARLYEYEAVRLNPRTFIVAPGHVYPEVERVVDGNERFLIVEKYELGAVVAEETYTRAEK